MQIKPGDKFTAIDNPKRTFTVTDVRPAGRGHRIAFKTNTRPVQHDIASATAFKKMVRT